MPNSEEVSQGGPANFARLFTLYVASKTPHKWIGVMFDSSKKSTKVRLKKIFSFSQRDYFKLYLPKIYIRQIVRAKKLSNPADVLQEPIARLVKLIKKEKPDVVFLNGFGIFNWMLLKAAEKTGVPVIIQHAGIWTKELNLHKDLYSSAGLKMMKNMEKDSTEIVKFEVFLNNWSRDYYQKKVATKTDNNTVIIPLPFDFASFERTVKSIKKKNLFAWGNRKKRIGVIARWDRIKDHASILALAKMAKKNGLPWQFYSVTKIPEKHHLKINKESYEKNIKVIHSLGRVGISKFCGSMDLLILPSLFDVSPTVVLEAIAAGTPVAISPNVGYVDDFISCGAKDWIIDFKNKADAIKRIKKIIKRDMPQELCSQIISKHDYQKVFLSYLYLFESVMKKEEYSNFFPVLLYDSI